MVRNVDVYKRQVKLRFGIIGNNEALMRAIDIAIQVAPTDLSVLITGESGVGKEMCIRDSYWIELTCTVRSTLSEV